MIKNVVFDMGQVLIHWRPQPLMEPFGLSEAEEQMLLQELFHSVEWVQMDHGTIDLETAAEQVCARLPEKLHEPVRKTALGWWERPLVPMENMAELVRELKEKGYGIYLLSNASLPLRSYFHRIPGSECFDGIMVSAEEKLLKPQHAIFERLYERFNLNPGECVFIDDAPANVEGAICTGMSGVIFRGDAQRLRRELRDLGVSCD